VILTSWRITKRKHAKSAFDGAGARKYGGRWNSAGIPVIYTAQSQSLAVLEMLVHLETASLLSAYVLFGVEVDESLIQNIERSQLPANWRENPPPAELQKIGNEWALAASSVVLRVPSTLVPAEHNFLLNPAHADFHKLRISEPVAFYLDARLSR